MRFLGIRLDLSPGDKVVKRKLAKCLPCAHYELIRSDIPGSSGSRSSRHATLRPSPSSVMKFSHDGPPIVKPTKGELLAQVETLSQRSRRVKRKTLDSPEKGRSAWGKVLRLGTSSSSPFTHVRKQGQVLPPPAEVPRAPSSQLRFGYVAKAKDSSGKAAEPPLEVIPITVWSPPAQNAGPPPSRAEELGGGGGGGGVGGSAPKLMEMGIPCSSMLSLRMERSRPFSGILISRGQVPCLLGKPWLYLSRGSPL